MLGKGKWAKFESRDEWLGIREWGLGVTRRHQTLVPSLKALPRNLSCRPLNEGCVKAEIRSTKASFLCRCLCDTDRSARKTLGYASDDDSAKHYQNSAALHYFMRRTTISHFAFLISNFSFKRSFQTESKGSTPQELTVNPTPSFLYQIYLYHTIKEAEKTRFSRTI